MDYKGWSIQIESEPRLQRTTCSTLLLVRLRQSCSISLRCRIRLPSSMPSRSSPYGRRKLTAFMLHILLNACRKMFARYNVRHSLAYCGVSSPTSMKLIHGCKVILQDLDRRIRVYLDAITSGSISTMLM